MKTMLSAERLLGTKRVATDRQSLKGVLVLRGFRSLLGLLRYRKISMIACKRRYTLSLSSLS